MGRVWYLRGSCGEYVVNLRYRLLTFYSALYTQFPLCRYPWAACPRSAAPTHQRHVQGPPRNMGVWIPHSYPWQDPCEWDNWWHWPMASHCICLDLFYSNTTQDLCCPPISWSSVISWWARLQAVDGQWLKGTHEGEQCNYICPLSQLQALCLGVSRGHCRLSAVSDGSLHLQIYQHMLCRPVECHICGCTW